MPLTVFTSDRFADHLNPPGHPERVERAEVMQVVAAEFRSSGGRVIEPRPATDDELARVHDPDYLRSSRETAGRATALDPDTYTSPIRYEVACLAAGAGVAAVDHVLDGPPGRARSRWCGRPGTTRSGTARWDSACSTTSPSPPRTRAPAALARVAIVDYDVHHGNGTQWSFYDDPSVLFVSSHQFPFYPGTGEASAIGTGAGQGFTVNLPVEAGGTDADFEVLYTHVAVPVLRQFRPELILLSAGFDAHADDPLGGMRVSTDQLGRLTGLLDLLVGDVGDALGQGERLEPLPQLVDLLALGEVELGDPGAAVRADDHQPLGLELPQCLADRDPADAELLRHRLLADRGACLEHAVVDCLAQPARDVLGSRLVALLGHWIHVSAPMFFDVVVLPEHWILSVYRPQGRRTHPHVDQADMRSRALTSVRSSTQNRIQSQGRPLRPIRVRVAPARHGRSAIVRRRTRSCST